jgi:5-methyltetrahydropteroyltriglutamate--homocysteine methyltransferase
LDEPSICFTDKTELIKNAIEEAVKGVSAQIILSTYFGSVRNIFPAILDFPVDVIGIDFVSVDNKSVVKDHDFTKALAFGVMDARNTKLEAPEYLKKETEWALGLVSEDKLYVKPNFGFDLLPHGPVLEKLKVLGEVKNE